LAFQLIVPRLFDINQCAAQAEALAREREEGHMDPMMVSLGATRLRRRLVVFLGGMRRWPANEKARRNLQVEIDTLDRTGLLDEVLRYVNLNRRDMLTLLNADSQTPRRRQDMLEWLDLADRMRGDDQRNVRDAQAGPTLH
jgi:hypothetical protein